MLAGLGVGGIAGTTLAGRADRSARPRAVLVGALLVVAVPAALMAVTPQLPGLLLWAVVGGAGAVLVEVLCETALQRELDEQVFPRAYGIALPVSIAGIVVGSLVAAPLVALVGLTGAIAGTGLLAGGYAAVVALPRRRVGRHRAAWPPYIPAARVPACSCRPPSFQHLVRSTPVRIVICPKAFRSVGDAVVAEN